MKIGLLLLVLAVTFAKYNEAEASRYVMASALAYCSKISTNDCGQASKDIASLGMEIVDHKKISSFTNPINAVVL